MVWMALAQCCQLVCWWAVLYKARLYPFLFCGLGSGTCARFGATVLLIVVVYEYEYERERERGDGGEQML
jgi:hypothetical protein